MLERLAASVKYNEPVLMVGETGTGKTTLVQDMALRLGQKLTVLVFFLWIPSSLSYLLLLLSMSELICLEGFSILISFLFWVQNLSQQSDVADLLGGFKPMNAQLICFPLYKDFEDIFLEMKKRHCLKVICVQ